MLDGVIGEAVTMKRFYILLILFAFAVPASGATIYKWGDQKGAVNSTDAYKKVPPGSRNRVEAEEYLEAEPPSITKIKEEVNTDVRGRDYWKKQLEEATVNCEKAGEELLREGERLISHGYGSKSQYQMFTEELPSITERVETYKKQKIEAKAILDKFTEEVQATENTHGKRTVSPKTDIYGRDETWWKEKVRPWKEQLKKATENYEEAFDTFVKQLERLGPFRWGEVSLTQYQMISSRLTVLDGRIAQDQTQISEAKGVLAKLSEEAKETKADPAWLE